MENAMISYKKAWISTYQERVKRISGMNSWYEIMVFCMNSYFCVWISTYQERGIFRFYMNSYHEIMVWIHNVEYEIMVLGDDFKPLLENGLFMVWINTMKFLMKFGINSWYDGMNSYNEIYVLNICTKQLYEIHVWINNVN